MKYSELLEENLNESQEEPIRYNWAFKKKINEWQIFKFYDTVENMDNGSAVVLRQYSFFKIDH